MIALIVVSLLIGLGWVVWSLASVKMPPSDWEQDDWQ